MTQLKLLVTGDRDWTDEKPMAYLMACLPEDTIVIHGACRGADMMADKFARLVGAPLMVFPIPKEDWKKYRRAAGVIRNQRMLDEGRPHFVVAFHDDLENNSRGTLDMVRRSRKKNLLIIRRAKGRWLIDTPVGPKGLTDEELYDTIRTLHHEHCE